MFDNAFKEGLAKFSFIPGRMQPLAKRCGTRGKGHEDGCRCQQGLARECLCKYRKMHAWEPQQEEPPFSEADEPSTPTRLVRSKTILKMLKLSAILEELELDGFDNLGITTPVDPQPVPIHSSGRSSSRQVQYTEDVEYTEDVQGLLRELDLYLRPSRVLGLVG